MRRASRVAFGGHRAGLLARLGADELRGAADRIGRDAPPQRRPQDVRVRHHRLRRRVGERAGHDLRRRAPWPENFAPGLHVPRMPSVSHMPCLRRACTGPSRTARAPDRSPRHRPRAGTSRAARRRAAPYDTVVASLSSVILSPLTSTAHTIDRVSPNVPFSDVIDAITSWRLDEVVAHVARRRTASPHRGARCTRPGCGASRAPCRSCRSPARARRTGGRARACRRPGRRTASAPRPSSFAFVSAANVSCGKRDCSVDVGRVLRRDLRRDRRGPLHHVARLDRMNALSRPTIPIDVGISR